jgi:hypothetical protein
MGIGPPDDADLPLVTVVTPSFNQGRFIAATIESVLAQDYPHLEYIIVDGASTDDTAAVVAPYADRLTFLSEPDRGQSDAINKGFRRARGQILAWLNSDDIFLPGAVRAAVSALRSRADVGAVYGEGYQIDERGGVISRFAPTQRYDLWRLLNLSDYILQQTVFFRRDVFDDVGWIDEDLHYGMDWDILIRIGLQRPLLYVPHEMGAIREYASAKSFAGGAARVRELARILRRHTGKRFPPGMFVYGLPAYERIANDWIARTFRGSLGFAAPRLQRRVTWLAHRVVGTIVQNAQGWYSDDWATKRAQFAFSPSRGRRLALRVELPPWAPFERQEIALSIDGRVFARERFGKGAFTIPVAPPPATWERPVTIELRARRSFRPRRNAFRMRDDRRLCYLLRSFDFEDPV